MFPSPLGGWTIGSKTFWNAEFTSSIKFARDETHHAAGGEGERLILKFRKLPLA